MLDLLTVAVLALVGTRLVGVARSALREPMRSQVVATVAGLRPRHVLPVPFVLTAVALAAAALLQVPGLDWGWWSALGGYGNPVAGSTDRTVGTPLEWAIPLVFAVLLLPGLPLFAEMEERVFRRGAEHWSTARRLWRGVIFGLAHALVGIPIGVALALAIGGWWFTAVYLWGYRRGGRDLALRESTLAHLAYNLCIVILLLASLVLWMA